MKYSLSMIGAGVMTIITTIIGKPDYTVYIFLGMICLDYVTGVLKAYVTKEVSSKIGAIGILKKSVMLIPVILAVMLDRLLHSDGYVFRTATCWFYIANEGYSILENLKIMGIPIPDFISKALKQIQDTSDKNDDKTKDA